MRLADDEICQLCNEELADLDIALLESGEFVPKRHDPRFSQFKAHWKMYPEKQPSYRGNTITLVRLFHLECLKHLVDCAGKLREETRWWECQILRCTPDMEVCKCPTDFRRNKWAYKITAGRIQNYRFEPDIEIRRTAILCSECISRAFVEEEKVRGRDQGLDLGGYHEKGEAICRRSHGARSQRAKPDREMYPDQELER